MDFEAIKDPREREQVIVARCVDAALNKYAPENLVEANVFFWAASIIWAARPEESQELIRLSSPVLKSSGTEKMNIDEMFKRGLVLGLPRLKQALLAEFVHRSVSEPSEIKTCSVSLS